MWRFYALAILLQLVWGLSPSASRLVLEYLPVEFYIAIRFSISGVLFGLVSWSRNREFRFRARDLPKLAGLGIVTYAFASLGILYALKLGGVLNFSFASSFNAV